MDNEKVPSHMVLSPAPTGSLYYHELAADFIEQQVGRYRWRDNIRAMIQKDALMPLLSKWLHTMRIKSDPKKVIAGIRDLLDRKGNWWQ